MTNPKPSRTRWKIALGVVFAVVWLVGFPAYQRHRAIEEIERAGGHAIVEGKGPQWLGQRGLWFQGVVIVRIEGAAIDGEGLKHLSSLAEIEVLVLADTKIADTELEQLKGLSKLSALFLYGSTVNDAGLEHLKGFSNLRSLDLSNTQVTAEGVKGLKAALPNCEIVWK